MANPKQPSITIAIVPITPWEEYRGVVRVWNERGIYSERSSDGVRIEPSPPLPRQVVLRNSAVENETSRWLPNLHLPSFNFTGFDPDVTYVSSPDDITIAVSDFSDGANSSYVKLNNILDSGAFSPSKEFKLLVTRIVSDANETNNTEQNFETKTLSGFADPSGPCCADHTPNWLNMNSDIHYKPTSIAQEFGSSVVQLPNDYVVVSSIHKLFFFSKKDKTKNKVVFLENDKIVNGLSYSDGDLIVSCSDRINVYKLQCYDDITLQLVTSISNCKNHHCSASDVKWSELDKGLSIIQNETIITKGKTEPHNYSVIGVFRKNHSLRWKLVKVLGESDNSHRFGSSFAINGKFLAVLSNSYTINIYSTVNFSQVMQIGLHSYRNIFKPDLGLSQDNALILVSRSRGHIVVLHLNYTAKSSHKVCSYFLPSDIRLSGNFDLFHKDNGTVIVLGMQTARGLDGVILTSFYGTSPYHLYYQNGKCLGLGQILSREKSLRVDDGIPRASVSVKGSTILFGTPGVLTWPDGSEKQGTGRVYSMVFCSKNYKRVRITNIKGQEAFQCEPCENGRKSLGAITRICEICKERRCASYLDDDPIHFVTEICNSSQCPLVKRFNNKTNAITTIPENGSFFEEGVSNEYVIKLVETTRAGISTTSMSKPFIIDTSSPTVGTVYDGLDSSSDKNCSNNETLGEHSQCSTRDFMDTDIDYTHNTTEVHARWIDFADNESDIAEFFFCIGSKPMLDDIRQCQSTGLRQNASEFGFDFKQGDKYYVTVVACNGAQRCSAGHSNGVTVDTTPPVMEYVRDGVMGSDIDYQVFLDLLFVFFKANDSESGIRSYEVAWGTEPGLVDLKDYEEIMNTTVWYSEYKDNKLKKHKKYYATVRAANKAGLLSHPMSSDGVQVGKSEYLLGSNDSASFFFDTVDVNPNGTRRDGGVGKTYGTLNVPKGALKDEVKLTSYSLDQKTLESNSSDDGPVSNPEKTKPKQFMFGNYSFQIKAFDPKNNTVREGYTFVKPIKIFMFYDVDSLVNANKRVVNKELGKEDIDPVLYLWDFKNKTWMDASLTCPEPWSYVNRSIKLLTVKICHLTQFAFYWMFKAQNGLMMFDKNTSVYEKDCGINIVQQSSVQQVNLTVRRSKGSQGYIEVTWSSHSNVSNYDKIIWPLSGTISFKEAQWNSTIVVSVASNDYPTLETFIWVHLDSTTGGALLASEDLTTTKLTITSAQASTVKSSSNKWVVTGVSLGLIVLVILIVVIVIRKRNKLAEIMRSRRKAETDKQASNPVEVEMSIVIKRENKGFQQSLENVTTAGQPAHNPDKVSPEVFQASETEVPEHSSK